MKIIINADDFGYSESINKGIIDSFKEGLISSTSMMMNMPAVDDAVKLSKKNPDLGVGLHINITTGTSVSGKVPSLTDENNKFIRVSDFKNHTYNYDELYIEIKAQIEKLKELGITPTHLDWHLDLIFNKVFVECFLNIALEYNLPIRNFKGIEELINIRKVKAPILSTFDFYDENAKAETIISFVNGHPNVDSIEIMSHVGYVDEETAKRTSYKTREKEIIELKRLKSMGFYDKIDLITYSQL